MRSLDWKAFHKGVLDMRLLPVLGLLALAATACGPEDTDGVVTTATVLPTDTLLNLACADAGIYLETCILDDPENPFAFITINEFDVNNPGAENKFEIANGIPAGPAGAKARFYFWATALARRASGENQYYTALALHELFTVNSDPIIKTQAVKAYRSVLDNFFGSVTFFGPFGAAQVSIPFQLNLLVADNLYRTAATGHAPLYATQLEALAAIGEWGYTYIPCSTDCPNDGLLYVNGG